MYLSSVGACVGSLLPSQGREELLQAAWARASHLVIAQFYIAQYPDNTWTDYFT